MGDRSINPDSRERAGRDARGDGGWISGAPRWVKVMAIVAVLFIAAFVVLHLTGNSPFGAGTHGLP